MVMATTTNKQQVQECSKYGCKIDTKTNTILFPAKSPGKQSKTTVSVHLVVDLKQELIRKVD